MFKNQSVLGSSGMLNLNMIFIVKLIYLLFAICYLLLGLVVLLAWIPSTIHFEPFSVNGSPFRPWHGDWFAYKGLDQFDLLDFRIKIIKLLLIRSWLRSC